MFIPMTPSALSCGVFLSCLMVTSLKYLEPRNQPYMLNPDRCRMGGVNTAHDYVTLMGFGYVDDAGSVVTTDALLKGGIVSVYYLGTLFGCLLGGWVGDKVGRTRTIALGAAWAVLGASLQCSSQNHKWMICGELQILVQALRYSPGVANDP